MSQSALAFQPESVVDSAPHTSAVAAQWRTAVGGNPVSSTGFQIGWDYAHHALVPPAERLGAGTDLAQGWMAGRAVFGRRTLGATRTVRLWLHLRLQAWSDGRDFDLAQVTPRFLAQIHVERCPVLRLPLGGLPGSASAAVVERLNPQVGFVAGNLAVMSQAAASARLGLGLNDLTRRARQAELCGDEIGGLSASAWWRLTALTAVATPALPHFQAARVPLAMLPPGGVAVLSHCLALQAALTRLFLKPGWSASARALAMRLPAHTLRHDFNLFIGAMAPRVLEAGTDAATLLPAMEDAWLNERVQRRWQHFVLSLGEVGCESLLAMITATSGPQPGSGLA